MDEPHEYFPSGTWRGVYKYPHEHDGSQHQMRFHLNFSNRTVTGSGGDDVGPFTWRGSYSTETFRVKLTKAYATHTVAYDGMADESGIYGRWDLFSPDQQSSLRKTFGDDWRKVIGDSTLAGGFHLWPSGESEEEQSTAEKTVVKELVISQP